MGNRLPITLIDEIESNPTILEMEFECKCNRKNKSKNKLIMDKIRIDLATNEVTICSTPCSPLSSCDATAPFIIHNGIKLIYINVQNLSSATTTHEKPLSPLQFEDKIDFDTFMQSPSWSSISNPYSECSKIYNDDEDNESDSPSSSSSKSISTPWILYNGLTNNASGGTSFSLSQSLTPSIDNGSILHIE